MRKLAVLTTGCAIFLLATFVQAQQADIAFGVSTTLASSYNNNASQAYPLQSPSGGAYPSISADVIFKHRIGIGGNVSWRASEGIYNGYQPYRPIYYDFGAVFQPRLSKRVGADVEAGIGGESIRFYSNYYSCSYFGGCTNYVSSNHFMGHFGGGIRFYVWHHFFVRPEAHVYLIHNNVEFSSGTVGRVGASIGYTLSPED